MKFGIASTFGSLFVLSGLISPLPSHGAGSIDVTDTGVGVGITTPLYNLDISGGGVNTSQMHFSRSGADVGGWVTSVLDNNFFLSSGAAYDNGWVQKSLDGKAVMAGSGGVGYSIFTSSGVALGANIPTLPRRLHINYNGEFGINTDAVTGTAISTSTGATLTAGGAWQNASSAIYKKDVQELTAAAALQALADLNPVTFTYKADEGEKYVGFIAEEVPDLVASADRKSLGALDIVAVLTKAVQEKSRVIDEQQDMLNILAARIARLEAELGLQQSAQQITLR